MDNQQPRNEIYKDIAGYEGYYQISNYGNVKSLKRKVNSPYATRTVNEKILKQRIDKYGYWTIVLRKFNKDKHFTVHRLVAMAFVENPNNFPCINHKDENKLNNYYENLEWCTVNYNNKYNLRQEKINNKLRNNAAKGKCNNKKIKQINLSTNEIYTYDSLRDMNRKTGGQRYTVKLICEGLRTKLYRNSIWKFI